MRLWRIVLLVIAGLLASAASFAQASKPNPVSDVRPIRLDGGENALLITPHAQVLEDPRADLALEDVRHRGDWQPGPRDALVFGFTRSAWWVRAAFENPTDKPLHTTIDLGNARQDYVTWHVLRNDGLTADTVHSGDRVPFAQRPVPERDFALPLHMQPRERVELYIRLQSHDGLYEAMPLQISSAEGFFKAKTRENLVFTLYVGGLIALALYNLLLYIATRERTFGIYVCYLTCFIVWSFTFRGYSFQHLWPNATVFNQSILTVSSSWSFAFFGWFALVYMRMRDTVPRWVIHAHVILIAFNFAVAFPAFADFYSFGVAWGHIGGLALTAVTMPTAIYLVVRGSRQARFFVTAFALLATGATLYILQIVAVVPTNWITTWSLQIGSGFEVLLLAIGLADSMNTLKAEKLEAETRALQAQQALNAKLEQQVSERTQALEVANRRLHELTITDELTGAFNRRHFNSICAAAIGNRDQQQPLAFCMFDIDYFKGFNDRYGHQAGDAALQSVARVVRSELRRSDDVLFRLGGEEFGVVFTAPSPEAATQFVDRLRLAIRALEIPHLGSPSGVLTASFGVGWWGSSVLYRLTAEQIYATADNALYAAKEAGRDRVETEAHFPTGMYSALAPAQLPQAKLA